MLPIKYYFYSIIMAISFIAFISSCTEPCAIPEYTDQSLDTITMADVQTLQTSLHEWRTECGDKCPLSEANNVWFSMESLANYISYAHHTASGMASVPEISGIRFYFGKNANNELTVVASATYKPENSTDEAVNHPDLGYGALNYGQAGMPPKKDYPH